MRIVFVLGSYLPKCSAVGNCVKNLVDVLQEEHEVTVICQARSRHEPTREKIAGYDVVRVHTTLQDYRAMVESSDSGFWHDVGLLVARCARAISIASPRGSLQSGLVRAYRSALESLTFEPDLLVPTCLPFEAVAASAYYAEHRTGMKLVPYLFDQFADSKTINCFQVMGSLKRRANLRLERKLFKRADSVLHITWSEHVVTCLPDLAYKFVRVEHPLLVRPKEQSCSALECRDVVYAGALDPEVRNPTFTLNVLGRVLAGSSFGRARFYVTGYEKFKRFFDGVEGGLAQLLPSVSSDEVRDVLAGAEWLLSIGNNTSSQKVSKVYEYMAYGKPIIHIASRRDDEVAAELSRYPLSCCLYEGDGIEFCAKQLRGFLKRTRGLTVDFDVVAALFENELPSVVARALIAAGGGSMIFTGAFTARVRPDYLLSLMAEMGPAVRVDVRTSELWVARLGTEAVFCNGKNSVSSWVDSSELTLLYEANDVLLSIADSDGRQMSSKIFSYMATGKPIVHIYYTKNDVNLRYLLDYPLALCVKADSALVVQNAQLIELFLLWATSRHVSSGEVEARFTECTPAYVADLLLRFGETASNEEETNS